ncbi:MAG: hypothetical protein S4CHLAM20_10730 [Chlamydiia bacterium]|nr:hypothetical protein [Chlamydiia bacterium]
MKKYIILFLYIAMIPVSAAIFTVTSPGNAGAGSFRAAAAVATGADTIEFNLAAPFRVNLNADISLTAGYTINCTNNGDGISFFEVGAFTMTIDPAITSTFTGTGTTTLTLDFASSNTSNFVKSGSGEMVLLGDGVGFLGLASVTAGQLTLGSNTAVGNRPISISDGATLALRSSVSIVNQISIDGAATATLNVDTGTGTITSSISGVNSAVDKTGAGTLTLNAVSSYTGGTTISAGVLNVAGQLASTGDVTVNGTSTFNVSNSGGFTIGTLNSASGTFINLGAITLVTSSSTDAEIAGVVQGAGGSLNKQGSSTLTLSGTNTYDTFTRLQAGQITLANNAGLGTSALQMSNTTTLALNSGISPSNNVAITGTGTVDVSSGTGTLSGIVSGGGGSLTKTGAGTLALSGVNTYDLNTTLSAGQITLSNNAGLGTSALAMATGTTLALGSGISASNTVAITGAGTVDVTTGTGTLSGVVSGGGGSLTKTGAGTLSLGGVNTYNGGTTVSTGTLAVTGSLASTGNVTVNGSSIFDINGSSGVSIGALTTAASTVVNLGNQTLTTNTASNTEAAGVIQGAGGSLIKQGSSTLTLSNTNTYDTNTTLSAGQITLSNNAGLGTSALAMATGTTLALGSGISASNNVAITGTGTVDVSSGTGTLSGVISGVGSNITKSGAGTLSLTGTNTISGVLTLNAGDCVVNGVYPGNVTTTTGTDVSGTGTIGGTLLIVSGGSVTPGNSIGTLSVDALTLNAGSTTNIEFGPSSTSLIDVTNAATIAGTLNLTQNAGSYTSTGTHEIITAGTRTGEFDAITGGLSGFTFNLTYDSTSVFLNWSQGSGSSTISTTGLTGNVLRFANYLNENATSLSDYALLANLSGTALFNALNSASPARNFSGTFVTQETMFSFSHIVNNYLRNQRFMESQESSDMAGLFDQDDKYLVSDKCAECSQYEKPNKGFSVWISGFLDFANQGAESQNVAFDFNSEGVLLGVDYDCIPNAIVGAAIGYAHSQIYQNENMGKSNIPYYIATVYGGSTYDRLYVQGAFWGAFHQNYNERNTSIANVDTTAKATINGWQIDPHLEVGYMALKPWRGLEPFVAVDWVINWEDSYKETGPGGLNMEQKAQTSSMLQTEVGVRFFQQVERQKASFGLKESVSYINRTPYGTGKVRTAIVGTPQFITLTSFSEPQNLGAVNVTMFTKIGKKRNVVFSLGYEGQFGSNYTFNEVVLKLAKSF